MIFIHFLFATLFYTTLLNTLNNPFSCTRNLIPVNKAQSPIFQNFKFIGLIENQGRREAIIQWDGTVHTVTTGQIIGPIKIKEIKEKNIRIVKGKEEFILGLESE